MHTMAQERANPAATELLLTIEPLVRSSFRPVVESMSLTEVEPGARSCCRVAPIGRSPGSLSAWQKGGKEGGRTCRDKKVVPYDRIFNNYRVDIDPKTGSHHKRPSSGPVEDKIYFFRYLILQDDLVYFSSQPMSDARYEALASLLASKAPQNGKGTEELAAREGLERAKISAAPEGRRPVDCDVAFLR